MKDEVINLAINQVAPAVVDEIWNRAIEAAAITAKEYLNSKNYKGVNTAEVIRKLKK